MVVQQQQRTLKSAPVKSNIVPVTSTNPPVTSIQMQPILKKKPETKKPINNETTNDTIQAMDISGKKITFKEDTVAHKDAKQQDDDAQQQNENGDDFYESRLLKPLPDTLFFGELRELADVIQRYV